MKWSAYARLARVHKPAGTLLLWCPTAWALWIANQGRPSWTTLTWFLLGTLIMRAAGCVMNDIADRNIDLHVQRTKNRPLTAGEVGLKEALALLLILLIAALLVLIQLPVYCFYYAVIALLITVLYPFCKRLISGPQLILGIAFSMGIPMAFAASAVIYQPAMIYLLIINFFWIVAYDTQYAMADRRDDLLIGVKSTAILFANYDRIIIAVLQIISHLLWIPLTIALKFSAVFYILWALAALVLVYQQILLATGKEEQYLKAFSSNSSYGLLLWIGIILGI